MDLLYLLSSLEWPPPAKITIAEGLVWPITYRLQLSHLPVATWQVFDILRLQTAESSFVSQWFSIYNISIRKPCTFLCDKRMGSPRQWKPEVALDFYVWPCLTDCRASDTDVINYLPALSRHHLELHVKLWRQPIPGKFSYCTFLKVVAAG